MSSDKHSMDMTEGPILKKAILYTLPVIATGVLQLLFNAADLIVVGRFSANRELSIGAVGATGALTSLMVNFFIGLSVGAGVGVAQAVGAHDEKAAHRTVHTAIPTAICSGLLLTVVCVLFGGKFLEWMDTPDSLHPLSETYLKIYFCGAVFNLVYNYGAAILRAVGDTARPLFYLMTAGVTNVCLNLLFVIVFHLDVAGVALATTVSQAISAVLVMRNLMTRKDVCRFEIHKMRFYKAPFFKMVRVGLPAGIQSSLFSISNVMIQSSVNSFGDTFVSGAAAASNVEGFAYTAMNAFHHTALNFTAQNVGAKRYDRVKRVLGVSLACVFVVGLSLGGLIWLFGRQLLGIYIVGSPQAIENGMVKLTFVCLPYVLCGLMDVTTGAIRGMGAGTTPMVITVLGVCGTRIGFILTMFPLPLFHSPEALFMSYPVSWILTFGAELIAYAIIFNKLKQKVKSLG